MYTLTFLLKEGEEIASHYGICVKHPVSYITHKGMPPRDAMADTVRRLIMAGYVNEIYEITGLTKLGDVEIYAGYRYYSNEMSRHPVSTDWNYIRSVAYNRSFLLHTDLARVTEAFLDWQDEDGMYEWEDGNRERMALLDYRQEKEGLFYGTFLKGLYLDSAVMEAILRDDHLIALYREDVKTIRPVKSA